MLKIAGSFSSTFGTLALTQNGTTVTGKYPHEDGRVEGVLDGRTLRGTWVQPPTHKRGPMELDFDERGASFRGRWKNDGDDSWRGEWDGERLDVPSTTGPNPAGHGSHTSGPLLAGPLVGEVGERDVRIWAQARDAIELTVNVRGPGGYDESRSITPARSEWLCATFAIEGLSPGATYTYDFEAGGATTPKFELRTAPPAGARSVKIAYASCFWEWPNPSLGIFDAIGREDPALLLMIGDNAYYGGDDVATEHAMMMAQLRHRNNPAFRRLVATTPTVAVWDDHDFGPNDTDGRFPGKPRSFSTFKRMWANRSYGTSSVPGVFSRVRCGPVEVFLLDERYHRGVGGKHILGSAQLGWLTSALRSCGAPIKLVASPSQVLPEYPVKKGWDCFRRDAPEELEALLDAIEQNDIRGVVFISGDLHMANLMHLPGRSVNGRRGPEYWELTASPVANDPWNEGSGGGDPTLLREVIDRTNYGVLDVNLDRSGSEVKLLLRDKSGGTILEQPIPLADLRVR